MASLIQPIAISGARDSLGAVVAGGRVYLTVPGAVNTAVTAYTDADMSSAVSLDSGGYLLDSGGRANLYVASPCSVRIDNSAGVTVGTFTYGGLTADNLVEVTTPGWTGINSSGSSVSGARTYLDTVLGSLYTSLGGLDGKYRGTYGINDTNIKTEIEQFGLTPQRFGAKGDGVTDDTNAFLLLAAAQTASLLPVILPKASYKITSLVTFGNGVTFQGNLASISQASTAAGALTFGSSCIISNLSVSPSTSSTGAGITLGNNCRLSNVTVAFGSGGFTTGITAAGNISINASSVSSSSVALGGGSGIYLLDLSTSLSGTFTAANVIYGASTQYQTVDVANGGTGTPLFTSGIQSTELYVRFRGTTAAGTGTIGAPANFSTNHMNRLTMEFQATGGGTFTFNFNAILHGTAATTGAITSAQRQVWTFVYNPLDAIWVEQSHTATFA